MSPAGPALYLSTHVIRNRCVSQGGFHVFHRLARYKNITAMERSQRTPGMLPPRIGVFLATCALHVMAIYYVATQVVTGRGPLWSTLDVSFIATEKPTKPPPPAPLPVLLADAFAQRQLIDIPPPTVELAVPQEASQAIHVTPPDPPPQPDPALQAGQGYGPLTKPRVISGPDSQDRYPRASIRHKESGRTVVKICIAAVGTVDSVEVAQSSGYPRLDQAAVDIGWDYVFAPAVREGKSVAVCLPYGIRFRIATRGLPRRR
jgi:TonB family protein